MEEKDKINKDLILRERLAVERTVMANDRTLLSFIRTSLYFAIAGMTINEIVHLKYGDVAQAIFWIVSIVLLATGITKYIQQKKSIAKSQKHIGNYLLDHDDW